MSLQPVVPEHFSVAAWMTPSRAGRALRSLLATTALRALAEAYPAVRDAVGDDEFETLGDALIGQIGAPDIAAPHLVREFPQWLERRINTPTSRDAFLADLARIELAVLQARCAPDAPMLGIADLSAIESARWPWTRLVASPSLRLLSLQTPAHLAYEAFQQDRPTLRPPAQPTIVAVTRVKHEIRLVAIPRRAAPLLRALLSGEMLQQALESALQANDSSASQDRLFRWLRDWVTAGFFQDVA